MHPLMTRACSRLSGISRHVPEPDPWTKSRAGVVHLAVPGRSDRPGQRAAQRLPDCPGDARTAPSAARTATASGRRSTSGSGTPHPPRSLPNTAQRMAAMRPRRRRRRRAAPHHRRRAAGCSRGVSDNRLRTSGSRRRPSASTSDLAASTVCHHVADGQAARLARRPAPQPDRQRVRDRR